MQDGLLSAALTILGFYLTVVALLVTLGIARLETWFGRIANADEQWRAIADGGTLSQKQSHREDCISLLNSTPIMSSTLISFSSGTIISLSYYVGRSVESSELPMNLIYIPIFGLFITYYVTALVVIYRGSTKLGRLVNQINPTVGISSDFSVFQFTFSKHRT